MFLTSKALLQKIATTGLITWLDHAPVSITISMSPSAPRHTIWRMNTSVLGAAETREQIQSEISSVFASNSGTVSNPSILWNAHKSFLPNIFLKLGAQERKKKTHTTNTLLDHIRMI